VMYTNETPRGDVGVMYFDTACVDSPRSMLGPINNTLATSSASPRTPLVLYSTDWQHIVNFLGFASDPLSFVLYLLTAICCQLPRLRLGPPLITFLTSNLIRF
jgi:hypothetical protein